MPGQQDHDAFDLEFICEEGLLAPLTNARPARFGFCGTCKSFGERRNRTGDGPPLAPAGDIPAALGLKTFLKETPMIDRLELLLEQIKAVEAER